jgi:hypothetical protein
MTEKFIIKPIQLTDIRLHGSDKYNSNNHGNRPDDYDNILEQSSTKKWIHLFKPNYIKIVVNNPQHIYLCKLANKIGQITCNIPNLFLEDMEELCKYYEGNIFDGTGFFVKVNNVSLKYGVHGLKPYYNMRSILESCVTCIKGHSPINPNTTQLDIYLLPYIQIDPINEFRVFVYNNKITCISQQNLYSVLYDENTIQQIPEKLTIILEYFENVIKNKINWINNYSYDFAVIENNAPYFIEMNSFGREYAAGSALFHWILDEKILYNSFETGDNRVEFRYTV